MKATPASQLPVTPVSTLFKALGDETRVRMVALLTHGELCVCHLQAALEISQPTASRQLAVLHRAGVVARRRSGSWIYFRLAALADPASQQQLEALCRSFSGVATLKRDVARLLKSMGPDSCL
jgi:ArsR family transcriptional regulator